MVRVRIRQRSPIGLGLPVHGSSVRASGSTMGPLAKYRKIRSNLMYKVRVRESVRVMVRVWVRVWVRVSLKVRVSTYPSLVFDRNPVLVSYPYPP
jgi:hypothetical protein